MCKYLTSSLAASCKGLQRLGQFIMIKFCCTPSFLYRTTHCQFQVLLSIVFSISNYTPSILTKYGVKQFYILLHTVLSISNFPQSFVYFVSQRFFYILLSIVILWSDLIKDHYILFTTVYICLHGIYILLTTVFLRHQ